MKLTKSLFAVQSKKGQNLQIISIPEKMMTQFEGFGWNEIPVPALGYEWGSEVEDYFLENGYSKSDELTILHLRG